MKQFKNWNLCMCATHVPDYYADPEKTAGRSLFTRPEGENNFVESTTKFCILPSLTRNENRKRIIFLKSRKPLASVSERVRICWEAFLESQIRYYFYLHPQTLQQALREDRKVPAGWVEIFSYPDNKGNSWSIMAPTKHKKVRYWREFDGMWWIEAEKFVIEGDCIYALPGKGKILFKDGPVSSLAKEPRDKVPCPFFGKTLVSVQNEHSGKKVILKIGEGKPDPSFEETME